MAEVAFKFARESQRGAPTQGGKTKDVGHWRQLKGAMVSGRTARRIRVKAAIGVSVEWAAIGTTRRDSEGAY